MLNLFPTSHRAAWKKFFALKEEERGEEEEAQGQQAQLELEHEEESVGRAMLHSSGPVQSEEAIRARKHFLKESQRWNTHRGNMLSSWAPPAPPQLRLSSASWRLAQHPGRSGRTAVQQLPAI